MAVRDVLTRLAQRFSGRSDDDLRAEIESLRGEKADFQRSLGRLLEDELRFAAEHAEHARAVFAAYVRDGVVPVEHPTAGHLALAWVYSQPAFLDAVRAALEADEGLNRTPRAEVEKRLASFDERIRAVETELARRERQRKLDEAAAELAALAERA